MDSSSGFVVCFDWFCVDGRRLFGDREIDHVPLLVDHRCVFDEEFERLPTRKIRAYRLQHASPFEIAPYLFDLLFEPLGQALDLGLELVVGHLDRLLRDHGAQRQVGEHGPNRTFAHVVDERLGLLTGGLQVLFERRVLMRQTVREIFDAPTRLVVDEHFRRGNRHEIGDRFQHLVASPLRLQLLHRLEPLADVGAQLVDGVELARLVDPLVGELGQHLVLRFLHDHAERRVFAGAVAEAFGQRRGELEDRAGTRRAVARRARARPCRSRRDRGSRWR